MKKVVIVGTVVVLILCIVAQSVSAGLNSARVRGYITDDGGNPIGDALVEWRNNATGVLLMSTHTNSSTGYYNMQYTFDGTIESLIIASKTGYVTNLTVITTTAGFIPLPTYEVDLTLQEETAPVVTTIEVTPSTKELEVGEEQEFTAIAKDQFGSEMSGVVITWTSSNTAVGTVSPPESTTGSGATTTFTALAEGTTTVKAENGTVNGTADVMVYEPSVVTTITVSPPSTVELEVGEEQQFTATAYDQYSCEMSGVVITWTSSNTAVGTVSPPESTTGSGAPTTFTALAEGTTTVKAENGTVNGTAEVTVEKKVVRRGGGGGGAPRDSDGDGYSDIQEMLAGTDENDPNDYPGAVVATPTPTPTPTVTPMPTIPPSVTPTPTPSVTPPVVPPVKRPWGLIIGIIIAVVIVGAAAYYFYTKKKA